MGSSPGPRDPQLLRTALFPVFVLVIGTAVALLAPEMLSISGDWFPGAVCGWVDDSCWLGAWFDRVGPPQTFASSPAATVALRQSPVNLFLKFLRAGRAIGGGTTDEMLSAFSGLLVQNRPELHAAAD